MWKSIICLLCVVVFQKNFLTHTLRDTPKSIFIFNSCQLLEKLDCFCAAISHYRSFPCQAFTAFKLKTIKTLGYRSQDYFMNVISHNQIVLLAIINFLNCYQSASKHLHSIFTLTWIDKNKPCITYKNGNKSVCFEMSFSNLRFMGWNLNGNDFGLIHIWEKYCNCFES